MLKKIIEKCPDCIQNTIRLLYFSIPDEIRYGSFFRKKYKLLGESQWWSKEQHEEYQMTQLKKLLNHAYENVPYYTNVFDKRGIKPKDIKSFEDLKKLPYLTKEIIQENLEDLIAKNYNRKSLTYTTTGGSTGKPMGFYIDSKFDKPNEWAFVTNLWNRADYDVTKLNRCVILRGNVPNNDLYEYKGRDLILSSYQLTNENVKKYIELIEKFNPDFIQAYPSSINIISDYILKNNIKIKTDKLRAILCASEQLYGYQRENIKLAFKVKVFSFYGHTEHACIAGECEHSNYYHIQSEYGYTELLDEYGKDVFEEDQTGEFVVTGFNNYVMPFIRYKTGDFAVNTNGKCKCKRNYKLIKKLEGREQEIIVTNSGAKISLTSIIFSQHFNAFSRIKLMQLVQNEKGKVVVNIVKHNDFSDIDSLEIKNKMEEATLNDIEVNIVFVNEIKRTNRGKHKMLIQNLNINNI